MDDFRRFPDSNTRQLIDYNRFVSLTGEKVFICLDKGVLEIARYLLNTRGLWRTTYVVDYVGTIGYNMPTIEQFQLVQAAIAEGNVDMSSCEEIAEKLQAIADAITTSAGSGGCGCGGGSRGAGGTTKPANPYNQAETPSTPPPGFDDMTQFNAHKCNAAADLLNSLASDLIGLSGIVYAGSSPTGLVSSFITFLLTPIPFDDLAALAAYLIYSAYSYTFLAEMAAQIDANFNSLVCLLYNSTSSEDAKSTLLAELETIAMAHFATTPDAEWVMGAIEYMLPYDATNKLFEPGVTSASDTDCSECGGSISPWTVVYGTASNSSPANPIEGSGVYEPGYGCLTDARHFGVSFSEPAKVTSFLVDGGLAPVCAGGQIYFYYANDDFTDLLSSTTVPPQTSPAIGIRSMYVQWNGNGIGDTVELIQEAY